MSQPTLERYPPPNLDKVTKCIENALISCLSETELEDYRRAVDSLILHTDSTIRQRVENLKEEIKDRDNWANDRLTEILLSIRDPLANSIKLAIRLDLYPGQAQIPEWATQPRVAAGLLHAVAEWVNHPEEEMTTVVRALKHQLDGLITTVRLPGIQRDSLQTTPPKSVKHAVVWKSGTAYKIDILDQSGNPIPISYLTEQLDAIGDQLSNFPLASFSWRLPRGEWATVLNSVIAVPHNQSLVEILQTSIVTLAIEEYPAPSEPAAFLSELRGGTHSPNRFADQTLGIIVFKDGEAGLTFDHVPLDCGAAVQLASFLTGAFRNQSEENRTEQDSLTIAQPLIFQEPPSLPTLPSTYTDPLSRELVNFDVECPHILPGYLLDPIIHLSYQAAIMEVCGSPRVIWQPVWQKGFHKGRCEPVWLVTPESINFIQAMSQEEEKSVEAFDRYFSKRKELIQEARSGLGPATLKGFYMEEWVTSCIQEAKSEDEIAQWGIVRAAWEKLIAPASGIHFTGFVLKEGQEGLHSGLSNIFLPNHLVCFYLAKPGGSGKVTLTICGSGGYMSQVESLRTALEGHLLRILEVAWKWNDGPVK